MPPIPAPCLTLGLQPRLRTAASADIGSAGFNFGGLYKWRKITGASSRPTTDDSPRSDDERHRVGELRLHPHVLRSRLHPDGGALRAGRHRPAPADRPRGRHLRAGRQSRRIHGRAQRLRHRRARQRLCRGEGRRRLPDGSQRRQRREVRRGAAIGGRPGILQGPALARDPEPEPRADRPRDRRGRQAVRARHRQPLRPDPDQGRIPRLRRNDIYKINVNAETVTKSARSTTDSSSRWARIRSRPNTTCPPP